MEFEAAQAIADAAIFPLTGRHLADVELAILAGAWEGKTYEQIAAAARYSTSYLTRTVGPQLWKLLSDTLGDPVSKTNFQGALQRRDREALSQEKESLTLQHPQPIAANLPAAQGVTAIAPAPFGTLKALEAIADRSPDG